MVPDELSELWREVFSGEPEVATSAPGRVNLIGEHTDYNDGLVMPAAISRRTWGLFRRSQGPTRLLSSQSGLGAPFRAGKEAGRSWCAYPAACAQALAAMGHEPVELEGVLWSDLPKGAGLSSSAALELCSVAAWDAIGRFGLTKLQMADCAWRAEAEFVGLKCGKMDQMASALGEKGKALLIDTRSGEVRPCAIPDSLAIAVLNTGKSRSLAAGAYNKRVAECKEACATLGVSSLRDVELDEVRNISDTVALKRARHVVTENERVRSFASALESSDLGALGSLMEASHVSLRDDYEVSCPELDAMVRSASGSPGCVGVRLTGAGFGGCCVALVRKEAFGEFRAAALSSYSMYGYPQPAIFETEADEGVWARPLDEA